MLKLKLFLSHMSVTFFFFFFFLSINNICHQCIISVAVLIQIKFVCFRAALPILIVNSAVLPTLILIVLQIDCFMFLSFASRNTVCNLVHYILHHPSSCAYDD